MVKKIIAESRTDEGKLAVRRALGKLEKVSLHKTKSVEKITAICNEVISRVGDIHTLVRLTPELLENLRAAATKIMNGDMVTMLPICLSEAEANIQDAKIRKDWESKKWLKNPPRGWVWRDKVEKKGNDKPIKEVVAVVYETQENPEVAEMYIDKEIYEYPHGALALIESIEKRHAALMNGAPCRKSN